MLALALPRDVLEIEVQEEAYLESSGLDLMENSAKSLATSPKRA